LGLASQDRKKKRKEGKERGRKIGIKKNKK
jgi:hypothetical protein